MRGWEDREGGLKELIVSEEGFEEQEKSELTNTFGAKRISKASCGCASAFPKEESLCSDSPSVGAGVMCCASIGSQEKGSSSNEVLGEATGMNFVELESAFLEEAAVM